MKSWTLAATETVRNVSTFSPELNETYSEFVKRKLGPYYEMKTSLLHSTLQTKCVPLQPDTAVIDFIENTPKRGYVKSVGLYFTKFFYSKTDALGMFGFGQMHVLSKEHAHILIKYARNDDKQKYGALLDVGAGCGTIPDTLRPLFNQIITTEMSPSMATALRERGYICRQVEDPSLDEKIMATKFDVITCFNVMDRCSKPISMLQSMRKILENSGPDAILIIAVVFPFSPYVEDGTGTREPEEKIDLKLGHRPSWEASVNAFKERVLDNVGLTVRAVSKVPYVSEGDYNKDWYTITDAIFVLSQ